MSPDIKQNAFVPTPKKKKKKKLLQHRRAASFRFRAHKKFSVLFLFSDLGGWTRPRKKLQHDFKNE